MLAVTFAVLLALLVWMDMGSFQKQKREQDLRSMKHLEMSDDGSGDDSESDSETEDEDAEMLTPALDLQVDAVDQEMLWLLIAWF